MLFSRASCIALICATFVHSQRAGEQEASLSFPLLLDATLDELREGLDEGHFTSVDLVKTYLARINETNPTLRSVTEINPDAISIAAELDATSNGPGAGGPLYGIPILVKDNIATNDEMNNTAGSYALLGAEVYEDSTVIAKLRKAGAIILGKTNLSQWAASRSHRTTAGWSAYGGQVVGAYYPGQDPLGSSSGSGVATSIGLAWASLGTDTLGSIISPSDGNNLVGMRPSLGLVSRYLVIPYSEHQDVVGPMARTVKDAAYLLSAIAGPDAKDNYTSAFPFSEVPDYAEACSLAGLEGKRIGVPRWEFGGDDSREKSAAFEQALHTIRTAGAEIVDDILLPGEFGSSFSLILGADLVAGIPENYLSLLKSNPNNISSVSDMRKFTQINALEEYPDRDTAIWDEALALRFNNTSPEFWDSYNAQIYQAGHLGHTGAFKNYSLDAIVSPIDRATSYSAVLGTPLITIPLGSSTINTTRARNGSVNETQLRQPFGIGFSGPKWSEKDLIGMAYAFEQRTLVRKTVKPYVQPCTELADVVQPKGHVS